MAKDDIYNNVNIPQSSWDWLSTLLSGGVDYSSPDRIASQRMRNEELLSNRSTPGADLARAFTGGREIFQEAAGINDLKDAISGKYNEASDNLFGRLDRASQRMEERRGADSFNRPREMLQDIGQGVSAVARSPLVDNRLAEIRGLGDVISEYIPTSMDDIQAWDEGRAESPEAWAGENPEASAAKALIIAKKELEAEESANAQKRQALASSAIANNKTLLNALKSQSKAGTLSYAMSGNDGEMARSDESTKSRGSYSKQSKQPDKTMEQMLALGMSGQEVVLRKLASEAKDKETKKRFLDMADDVATSPKQKVMKIVEKMVTNSRGADASYLKIAAQLLATMHEVPPEEVAAMFDFKKK